MGDSSDRRDEGKPRTTCEDNSKRTDHLYCILGHSLCRLVLFCTVSQYGSKFSFSFSTPTKKKHFFN